MLSGEGNSGERWKTVIGLISKKPTLHVQHTFSVHFFAWFCTTSTWNTFYGGNFVRVLVHFLSTVAHFHITLVNASISHFVTKNVSFVFYLFALDLCRPFSRWASRVCRLTFTFSPCLSLPLHSKFVDIKINLSLILLTTRTQKQFPLSVFVFIYSLVVSVLQDAGGYAISRQNNLELHLGCHTCCWVILRWYACGADGLSGGGGYGHVIAKFSRMGR